MAATAQVIDFPARPGMGHNQPPEAMGRDPAFLPLSRLREQLENYKSAKVAENDESQEADRYYHDDQWTADELKVLKDRGQPAVVFNREKRKVNTIVGILEKARQDPKGWPNKPTPGAQDGAELATKVVRYLLGWDWQNRTVQLARRGAVRAIAGVELVLVPDPRGGNPSIELDDVDQRDWFYDPRSQRLDFSDSRFKGTERWVDIDEAEHQWPDRVEELQGFVERQQTTWDKADTRNRTWYNKAERQVRIVDHWYRRGTTWYYCIYCGDVILEEGESPHRDTKGRSDHKYRMFSCEIDQDGDRYGFHRTLKGPQDEINHRRSKALHALNTRRVEAEKGAFDDPDQARKEAAKPDGFVERNPGYDAQIVTNDMDVQGNMEMLNEAKNEIDNYGPNPALIGTTIDAASGKAIQLLQAAGIAELGSYIIAFKHWKLSVYRMLWCAAQQFWTAEQWIAVTNQDGLAEFVQVNGWERDEYGFPVVINNLAQLDVDLILDEGPDTVTAMDDTFDQIVEMAGKGMQIPPDVIIELSRLPSSVKKKVLAMLAAGNQPNPLEQQGLVVKLLQEQAKVQQIQGDALLKFAQADKTRMEAMQPPDGPGGQIDTPADLAKARLDEAKAAQIVHEINGGGAQPPSMFDVAEQAARTRKTDAEAARTQMEVQNLAQFGTTEPAKLAAQREANQSRLQQRPASPQGAR